VVRVLIPEMSVNKKGRILWNPPHPAVFSRSGTQISAQLQLGYCPEVAVLAEAAPVDFGTLR
jgi:hypothetical protein